MKLFLKYAENKTPAWPTTLLEEMNIPYEKDIVLGEIVLSSLLKDHVFKELREKLSEKGFTILSEHTSILVQKIKYAIFSLLDNDELPAINTSAYISGFLHLNYTYLANVFSREESMTIERFIIMQKIEKAKKLLTFYEYEINHIAELLNYSSIGHFSNQFKKITGLSPSEYKKQRRSM